MYVLMFLLCWLPFQPWILVEGPILRQGSLSLCLCLSLLPAPPSVLAPPSLVVLWWLSFWAWLPGPRERQRSSHRDNEDNTDPGTHPDNGLLSIPVPSLYPWPPPLWVHSLLRAVALGRNGIYFSLLSGVGGACLCLWLQAVSLASASVSAWNAFIFIFPGRAKL